MRNSFSLHGVIVPLVTPFDHQNRIDDAAMRQVVDFVIAKGVHAVMVGGTTGEGMMLSLAERKHQLETVVEQTKGRVPGDRPYRLHRHRQHGGIEPARPASGRECHLGDCALLF